MPKFKADIQDGQVCRVRRIRLFYPEPKIGPWQDEAVIVQRHGGEISLITVDGFAEFDAREHDYNGLNAEGYHSFICEDYCLEIDPASL